jgi:hypothetical protein
MTKDTFLCEQNIRNITGKLAKETYKKHENDANNVRMWCGLKRTPTFYFIIKSFEVGGELSSTNISFTIGIQTLWQPTMMQQHGHQSVVTIDATFGTN